MADVYDMHPAGYVRAAGGWLVKPPSHRDKRIAKLEAENKELKEMIQKIMEKLGDSSPNI